MAEQITKHRRFTSGEDRHVVSTSLEGEPGEALTISTQHDRILRLLMVNVGYDEPVNMPSKAAIKYISNRGIGYDADIEELNFMATDQTHTFVPPSPIIIGDRDQIRVTLDASVDRTGFATIHYLVV